MKFDRIFKDLICKYGTLSRDLMPKRPGRTVSAAAVSKKSKFTLSNNSANLCQNKVHTMSYQFQYEPDIKLTGTATLLPTPEKSKTDKKDYRALQLRNGLKVLLISDASYPLDKLDEEESNLAASNEDEESDTEDQDMEEEEEEDEDGESEEGESDEEDMEESEGKPGDKNNVQDTGLKLSAAALCINMGSFSDPPDIPGMAHFLEHMVFMGSDKYPKENSFDAFNRKYGGFDNASTDCETTLFYFEIPRKNLLEGLDRFAQFFISPLMKKESMQREREAVDSEFEMALPSDYNRIAQIYGGIADGHPMAKFMWGNTLSLSVDGMDDTKMHQRLHEFRLRHYSSQYMTLAVQSQHDLDTMQGWIENIFSLVPNNGLPLETWSHLNKPFDNPRHHKLYRIKPVKNVKEVILTWALPSLLHKYESKPLHYLAWIIGHEGKGSLLSYLRKKVWALELYAGCEGDGFEFNSCLSIFTISVKLTQDGYDNFESVLSSIFSYLDMVKEEGPNSRIFQEIQEIEQLGYDYKDQKQPSDNVESLAENMHFYPPERYLDGDDLLFKYEPDIIKQCTDALEFETVNIFVKSPDFGEEDLDKLEPWFSTKYSESDIPESWIKACKDTSIKTEFHLPEPNVFIAKDVSIRDSDIEQSKFPVQLHKDALGELYYKKDTTFLHPRVHIYYHLRSPLQLQSLENAILLDLMVNCLAQICKEDVYPADLAQLYYSMLATETGFSIKVSGLSDKIFRLLEVILHHLVTMEENVSQPLFEAVLAQTRKDYYNHSIKPSKLVRDVRLSVLQDVYWSGHEKHNKIRDITLQQLKQFSQQFRKKLFLQALIQGNMTAAEAKDIDTKVRKVLNHSGLDEAVDQRCRQVEEGSYYLQVNTLNTGDSNTLVTNYYQAGPGCIRDNVILELAITVMEEPVFDTLRTKEQLGYSVYCSVRNTYGVMGFSIIVNTQASKYSSDHVDERIENFLQEFLKDHLNEEKVGDAIKSVIKQKVRADVTLSEEVDRNWSEILSSEYLFNRYEKELSILNQISYKEVLDYFTPLLCGEKTCRKLSVQVIGAKEKIEEENVDKNFVLDVVKTHDKCVQDIEKFRDSLKIHPVLHIVD